MTPEPAPWWGPPAIALATALLPALLVFLGVVYAQRSERKKQREQAERDARAQREHTEWLHKQHIYAELLTVTDDAFTTYSRTQHKAENERREPRDTARSRFDTKVYQVILATSSPDLAEATRRIGELFRTVSTGTGAVRPDVEEALHREKEMFMAAARRELGRGMLTGPAAKQL